MSKKNRIRMYVNQPLQSGMTVSCSAEQAHYLTNVLRLQLDDEVFVFNGQDGEFKAAITQVSKKNCTLQIKELFLPFAASPDVWLLFALLKKDNTDLVVVKATELGASRLCPVITEFTNTVNVRQQRLNLLATEAAEQSRRQDVPQVDEPIELKTLLTDWPQNRTLFYLDETGQGKPVMQALQNASVPAAFLIGPEGGFSQKELEILKNCPYTVSVTLGKRILRAETAALAALACWQAMCGDWL